MSGFTRGLVASLALSLLASGCTPEQAVEERAGESGTRPSSEARDFVEDSSIQLPAAWSYNLSRQGPGSWQFSMSPEPFNLGGRCERNGPLSEELLDRAEVFITGFAYVDEFPGAANRYKQSPGEFILDDASLANYEGFCHPTYRMDFELDDHYVSVHVAVSSEARAPTVDEALEVLNSIRS